jgi:hypothetical protein
MASPILPFVTYRDSGLQSYFTEDDFRDLLSANMIGPLTNVSLASAGDHPASSRIGTATVRKREDVKAPQTCQLRALLADGTAGSFELDSNFQGLTPLNNAQVSERTVEYVSVFNCVDL